MVLYDVKMLRHEVIRQIDRVVAYGIWHGT